jgi:hypothetical protein
MFDVKHIFHALKLKRYFFIRKEKLLKSEVMSTRVYKIMYDEKLSNKQSFVGKAYEFYYVPLKPRVNLTFFHSTHKHVMHECGMYERM